MANKITYGIKNVYYAPVTEALSGSTWTVTYGTPVAMLGARAISLSAQNENVQFSADNNPNYFTQNIFSGYEGDITMAIVGDDFRKACLGEVQDDNGLVGQSIDDKPKPFALLFQFEGDDEEIRHVLYRCIAGQTDVSSKTKETTIDPNEETISINCAGSLDKGFVKWKCKKSNTTQYNGWYTNVYVPTITPATT